VSYYYGKQAPLQYPEPTDLKHSAKHPCPFKPGTLLRIFIPAGTSINLANLLEVSSPSGICLLIRIPALNKDNLVNTVVNAVKEAGGSVEFL